MLISLQCAAAWLVAQIVMVAEEVCLQRVQETMAMLLLR